MPRRNTVLRRQARKIIYNVYNFMKKEAEDIVKKQHKITNVQERTAAATGTSLSTVKRILGEARKNEMVAVFRTPGKKRPRRNPITVIDNFDQGVIKRCIHNFHVSNKELPTIPKICAKLREDINFQGSCTSLRRIIKNLGFRWKKTENNRRVLIEKLSIRLKRIEYLEKIQKFRDEGKVVVYTDESYVHSTHTKSQSWTDNSLQGVKKSISKGQRLIIVHAGSESGFVPNALLTFKSGSKSEDYHGDMNYDNYRKWLETKLIPNLSPNSVIVVDNASYHNKQQDASPSASSRKADIVAWLDEKNIPHAPGMLKPKLYELVKLNKERHKKFSIDKLLLEHGHIVLRLPAYHPDLNPIEMAWGAIKSYVAAKNTVWTIENVRKLVEEKVSLMGQADWEKLINKVKRVEEEYRKSDHIIDTMTEEFIIRIDTNDDSDSDSDEKEDSDDNEEMDCSAESSTDDESTAGPSSGVMEGITPLL